MVRPNARRLLALALLTQLLADPAAAAPWHGAQYPQPMGGPGPGSGVPSSPGSPAPSPGSGGATSPHSGPSDGAASGAATQGSDRHARRPVSGAATGAGAPGGRDARAASASTGMGATDGTSALPDAWEQWWNDNQDRFLDLRARLVAGSPAAPQSGLGRDADSTATRRASADVVGRDILPVLFDLLGSSDEPEILDAAL
ncbi:MAG TPA: hypothetical protein VFY71_04120, partial [Planctomycetota bacterium]|nr:hypothetical protein [Planctomycetota bacterium]